MVNIFVFIQKKCRSAHLISFIPNPESLTVPFTWFLRNQLIRKKTDQRLFRLLTVLVVVVPALRFLKSCGEPPYWPAICFLTSAATVLQTESHEERRWADKVTLDDFNPVLSIYFLALKITAPSWFCSDKTIYFIISYARQSCMTHHQDLFKWGTMKPRQEWQHRIKLVSVVQIHSYTIQMSTHIFKSWRNWWM